MLPGAARHLTDLAAAGLVEDPASPWSVLSACVGAPSCQKSLINTRVRGRPGSVRIAAPADAHQRLRAAVRCTGRAAPGPGRPRPGKTACRRRARSVITAPSRHYDYVADPVEIYRRSFATIRSEADLSMLPEDTRTVAVRMIHACGDVGLVHDLAFHPRLVSAARGALEARAVIFTDTRMLAAGITRRRLPAESEVRCLVDDPRASELAERWETTRSAAAVSLWGERLAGAVVAIGNAPTALFHLLELIADGAPRPAAIIGTPVGFVGSAESKIALAKNPWGIPSLVVHGRRGGSALCAAAVNALAREAEL